MDETETWCTHARIIWRASHARWFAPILWLEGIWTISIDAVEISLWILLDQIDLLFKNSKRITSLNDLWEVRSQIKRICWYMKSLWVLIVFRFTQSVFFLLEIMHRIGEVQYYCDLRCISALLSLEHIVDPYGPIWSIEPAVVLALVNHFNRCARRLLI